MFRNPAASLPATARAFALLTGLAVALAACSPRSVSRPEAGAPARPSTSAPAAEVPRSGPVVVALLSPLTAADPGAAATGNAIANAARLAAEEPGGNAIDLRVYDTGGDAGRAGAAASKAVAEGAQLILGPLFGANTPAVASAVAGKEIKVISFSTDSSVAGDPVYVSGYLPEMEAQRILGYAGRQGLTTIGVYAPQNAYGQAAMRGADRAAESSGVHIATRMTYPRSFQDIQATAGDFARNAQASGVQAVLLPDYGDGLKIVGSFLDFNGLAPSRYRYLGLGQWESAATLAEPALRGGWFAGADPAAVQAFSNRYASRYGETPPFVAVLGYDAARIAADLAGAARSQGSRTPFTTEALTRPQGFAGALGPVRFLPDGRAERGLAILQVGGGGFEVLEPTPAAFGAGF